MEPFNTPTNYIATHLKVRVGPDGLHFFNRKTGLNVLVDELRPPVNIWSSAPRQVSIALTNACDLSCPHCYAPKNPAVLDFERVKGWLIELDANGCLGVGLGGGEPTLYPWLSELCSFAAKKTTLAVVMATHAHNLTKRLLNDVAGNLHFVRVSMDGMGNTYNAIRRRSFDDFVNRIIMLRDFSPFGINFLVNSKTIGDLDAATQLAEKLGASEFLLLPEIPVRKTGGIDNKTTYTLQKWVAGYNGNVPLSVSQSGAEGLPTCNPLGEETGLSAFAHIDASGTFKCTSYDIKGVRILGNGVIAALSKLKQSIKR